MNSELLQSHIWHEKIYSIHKWNPQSSLGQCDGHTNNHWAGTKLTILKSVIKLIYLMNYIICFPLIFGCQTLRRVKKAPRRIGERCLIMKQKIHLTSTESGQGQKFPTICLAGVRFIWAICWLALKSLAFHIIYWGESIHNWIYWQEKKFMSIILQLPIWRSDYKSGGNAKEDWEHWQCLELQVLDLASFEANAMEESLWQGWAQSSPLMAVMNLGWVVIWLKIV